MKHTASEAEAAYDASDPRYALFLDDVQAEVAAHALLIHARVAEGDLAAVLEHPELVRNSAGDRDGEARPALDFMPSRRGWPSMLGVNFDEPLRSSGRPLPGIARLDAAPAPAGL